MASTASAAAAPAATTATAAFPSGSWTLHFHDPADTNWMPGSYKKIGTFSSFADLWATIDRIGAERFSAGMFFLMREPYVPLWEHRSNINGGSYCIKVPEASALETFQRYAAAAILGAATVDARNTIVGVTISPKKGFHILKIWNASCKSFNTPGDIALLGDGMRTSDILYRPHVEQKF